MLCRKCKREILDQSEFCNYCGAKQILTRKPKKRGNGQGTVFKLPNGKYKAMQVLGYYMKEGKKQKKTVSRVFEKRSDAIAALPTLKTLVHKQKHMNLHELYEIYTGSHDYKDLSKSQRDKLGYAWNRWVDYEFTDISEMTVAMIEDQIEAKTSSFYPARDMKVLLSHLYLIAIKNEVVGQNKAVYADIPYDQPKAKRECWTKEEIDKLWKDYKEHPFTGYILILCYAGLRYGELSSILLENIHLDENYMIGGIKTDAGIDREIPIHKKLKPIIEYCIQGKKTKLLEMNEDNFYDAYWEVIHRTGLRELPPHTCRHYFFSRMTSAGVQGGLIAEVGGHASYLTTLKNYVRTPLKDKLKAVNSI